MSIFLDRWVQAINDREAILKDARWGRPQQKLDEKPASEPEKKEEEKTDELDSH